MQEKQDAVKHMMFFTAKIMNELAEIASGDYSSEGRRKKYDNIEYFLSELDVYLGKAE